MGRAKHAALPTTHQERKKKASVAVRGTGLVAFRGLRLVTSGFADHPAANGRWTDLPVRFLFAIVP
jgi:hypothetical protein